MRKGFTLVEIMIVVAIVALLAAIAIPNLLRARVTSSEAYAQATLRTISTACEEYASANAGSYPSSISSDLVNATPPYLNEDYTDAVRHGYTFACGTLGAAGYSCTAQAGASISGASNFTITTGGVLTSS